MSGATAPGPQLHIPVQRLRTVTPGCARVQRSSGRCRAPAAARRRTSSPFGTGWPPTVPWHGTSIATPWRAGVAGDAERTRPRRGRARRRRPCRRASAPTSWPSTSAALAVAARDRCRPRRSRRTSWWWPCSRRPPDGVVVTRDRPRRSVRRGGGRPRRSTSAFTVCWFSRATSSTLPPAPRLLVALEGTDEKGRPAEAAVALDSSRDASPARSVPGRRSLLGGISGVDAYHRAAMTCSTVMQCRDRRGRRPPLRDIDVPGSLSGSRSRSGADAGRRCGSTGYAAVPAEVRVSGGAQQGGDAAGR